MRRIAKDRGGLIEFVVVCWLQGVGGVRGGRQCAEHGAHFATAAAANGPPIQLLRPGQNRT